MIEILTALQTRFNASAPLMAIFPLGFYLKHAAFQASLPTCTLDFVSSVPEYFTGKASVNVVKVQFNVFSVSDTLTLTALEAIKTAFDGCSLTLATQTCLRVVRRNEQILKDDDVVWHAWVEYDLWVVETLP